MKYLKNFENIKNSVSTPELKSYCDNYLAFLYDEGYVVTLSKFDKKTFGSNDLYFRMGVKRDPDLYHTKRSKEFYWNDIKDQFIPFLFQLNKDYKIDNLLPSILKRYKEEESKQIRFWNYAHESYTDYTYEDILNDKAKNEKIVEVVFHVKDEI